MNKLIYCTASIASDLPKALLLLDSLRRVQGNVDLRILVAEHPSTVRRLRARLPGVSLLAPDEIGCAEWLHLAFGLGADDYVTALKPSLLRTLLLEGDVLYLAPELEVFGPLHQLEQAVRDADVVLRPPLEGPLPDRAATRHLLRQVPFDYALLGMRRGPASDAILTFCQELLKTEADRSPEFLADQPFAAALLCFAPEVRLLRSAQYSLSPVGLALHPLAWDAEGQPQTEEGPLLCFRHGTPLSSPAPLPSAARRLHDRYREQLAASPQRQLADQPYSFASYSDGSPIPDQHRRAFLRLARINRRDIDDPFCKRVFMERLIEQSTLGKASDLETLLARYNELERRLNTLPYSLVKYAGGAMGVLMPKTRDRAYNAMKYLSWGVGKLHHQLSTNQLGQALHDLSYTYGRAMARLKG